MSSIVRTAALLRRQPDLYSGNDDQVVPMLAMGGKGVISVMSNILPKETDQICERWFAGDTAGSLAMQLALSDMAKALFSDVNPIPIKRSYEPDRDGWGGMPPSLVGMSDSGREALAAVLKKARSDGVIPGRRPVPPALPLYRDLYSKKKGRIHVTKILLSGCNGKMGRKGLRPAPNAATVKSWPDSDINTESHAGFPVFGNPFNCGWKRMSWWIFPTPAL